MPDKITFLQKVLKAYKEGKLYDKAVSRGKSYLTNISYVRYCFHNPASRLISLHYPDYVKPDKGELKIVERIFCAFKKMKEDQKKVAEYYLPSLLWQEQLDSAYSCLTSGLKENDINKFHYFLSNFGIWKTCTGVESNIFLRNNMKSFLGRLYLKNGVFHNQLKIWRWFYNNRKPISRLSYPTYGNQAGACIDGVFVGVGSFFNEIYGSILFNLICDNKHPIIADLGGGYGKLAYFILRDLKNFTFIDFDLPETLCLASYYLTKVYPDKKVLFYGEEEYAPDVHKKYDLIFMPCWEIEKIGRQTTDLFINQNSLGEMNKNAVYNYLAHITNSTNYFFHLNHEINRNIYSDTERGLLGYEYPVPMEQFILLFRYPDIGHMLWQGFCDLGTDIFIYLYKRKF